MILNELIKPFLGKEPERDYSSEPEPLKNLHVIDDEPVFGSSFFDGDIFDPHNRRNSSQTQAMKIMQYRKIAQRPEVQEGIHEIINEIVFTESNEIPLKVHAELDNQKLQEKIQESFYKILRLANIDKKLFHIVKQIYVDGQGVMHLAYNKDKPKNGIQHMTMVDPIGLAWNHKENGYQYEETAGNYMHKEQEKKTYSPEEIVRVDFGLRDGQVVLSYLEQVIKVSNMLQSLEDMLIPLRFSRSVSRRVFNVDIGDLPPRRGKAVMDEYQRKFKYKKFYNAETGEISNQQHITSMVEDYWFQNRSGGKGTQVDVLDESGNLGEIDDILYFYKKLYKALGVPVNRQEALGSNYSQEMDFGDTRFSREEVTFYMFIARLRKVYEELFKEILRREVISTGVMTAKEWDDIGNDIKIVFSSELIFLDKMKMHLFTEKISQFRDQMEYTGKIFSQKTQISKIFNMNEDEIKEEMEKIQQEQKDPLFQHLYKDDGY